jgi:hypothetical protein
MKKKLQLVSGVIMVVATTYIFQKRIVALVKQVVEAARS